MIMPVARRARASWIPGEHGTTPDSGCSRPPAHRLLCAASWQQGDAAARARTHRARKISPLRLTAKVASMRTAQAKPLPCVAHAAPTQGGPGGACDEPLWPLTGGPGVEGDGLARGCPPCAWWLFADLLTRRAEVARSQPSATGKTTRSARELLPLPSTPLEGTPTPRAVALVPQEAQAS